MATLFNITEEQRRINFLLEESEGEITPELEELLAVNEANLNTKAESYRNAILKNATEIKAAKEEKKRIDALIKQKERANDMMQERIKEAMQTFGLEEININNGVGGRFSFRKSASLVIDNEEAVPDEYKKATYTIDKAGIKEAIKAGAACDYAHIEENLNLQIK